MEERSIIGEWYKDKTIFLTGGTGFMGKVFMEKLIFTSGDINKLYVLMRPKRGKSPKERLKDIWALPLFERVRSMRAHTFDKIIPIVGEVTEEGLGISAEDRKTLIENVNVVFHFAATLRLEAELIDSINMNALGTKRVVDLAKEMKKLLVFTHLSTAFCSADIDVFEEKVYDSPADPMDVINTARWMPKKALIKATPEIIKPHPNTYTYTKRLAETIVANEAKNMRVAIVRPSIVTPTGVDPIPGWVDTLNGPIGILVAAMKGVLRTMQCHGENFSHVVPVDMATNVILVVAWKLGSAAKQPETIPVYNITNDEVLRVTWGEVLELGRQAAYKYPFEMQVWYPNGDMTRHYWVYFIWSIFVHWIPAILIDSLMFIFRQPRFMIRVQKKIYNGLELLQFFTTRNWVFKSQNFLSLTNDLQNSVDREWFCMDYHLRPMSEYMMYSILGARQYCMKEDLSSLTRCRIIQKVNYVIDKVFKCLLIYGIFCLAWSYSDCVKYATSIIGDFIGNITNTQKSIENDL